MKFKKLSLDESLLDDFDGSTIFNTEEKIDWAPAEDIFGKGTDNTTPSAIGYDDDFSAPEYMPDMEDHLEAPEGPKEGSDTGVADLIISAIHDEWTAIQRYNSIIATLRSEAVNNPQYEGFITVFEEINNEENKHVGQLQEMLKQISPNANSIEDGQEEGAAQLNFANGKLQVQTWDAPANNFTPNSIDSTCTIGDVDDEM